MAASVVDANGEKSHKLDLYSIPVFLLEVLVLFGLAYAAYFIHFQYHHEPLKSGFYCDDISYRQQFAESTFTQYFTDKQNELTLVSLALAVPVALIVFCELVNSMFGALKFRQIRALCACCKLHSITRRTIRFAGAYALGLMIVMISCDILATSTGRLRPYFAQDCNNAYQVCSNIALPGTAREMSTLPPSVPVSPAAPTGEASGIVPASAPIAQPASATPAPPPVTSSRIVRRAVTGQRANVAVMVERQWVDLTGQDLKDICLFNAATESEADQHRFDQLAMSWPSFPAAVFTYACLFLAFYLSYVGTARPFRITTCVLVMLLLLTATVFDVQLVKEHYQHWDDVLASAFLALVVVVFVLSVYLNRFRDTHYYESQKLIKYRHRLSSRVPMSAHEMYAYTNSDGPHGSNYDLDKTETGAGPQISSNVMQNGQMTATDPQGGSIANGNDLAMRYFHIPRANYRGGSRPVSSLDQMR